MSECCELEVVEQAQLAVSDSFDIQGPGDVKVEVFFDGLKKIFQLTLDPYTAPKINATANPFREVGETYGFTWAVNIAQGRNPIISRSILPLISPALDLSLPFNVEITGEKKTSRQVVNYYSISATDSINHLTSRLLSIQVVNKVYLGFSYKDGVTTGQELTQSDVNGFTATLADTIKSIYGGLNTYTIPAAGVLKYIYWIYEAGTSPINFIESSGLPFPIVLLPGSLPVINSHDGSITSNFAIVRSYNKFGGGPISLKIS